MAYSNKQVADEIMRNGWAGAGQPVNASAIFSAAQGFGVPASQLDQVGAEQGWWGNTGATDWVTSKGLGGALGTQAPGAPNQTMFPGLGASPNPVANSPASPYAAQGAGTTSAAPTAPNPYLQGAAPTMTANPYLPAGGAGSNYGNDPRSGGPAGWGAQWTKGVDGAGGMPGTSNQGFGGLSDYLFQNPSTRAMGNELTRQAGNYLNRTALPSIRRGAVANGTLGGSRQGIAEGLAVSDSMAALAGSLSKLYGDQFNQDRGYGLQSDALDFNVHRGNLSDMRQGQLDELSFLDKMAGWQQQGIGAATQVRDQPFNDWARFVGPASQMAGLGGQNVQQLQGNPWLGAAGGALAGLKLFGG